MDIILQENNLFSRLKYFAAFYRTAAEVKGQKKRSRIYSFYAFYLILLFQSAYFVLLFLFPTSNPTQARLLGDYVFLYHFPQVGYFNVVGVLATSAYYLHLCYFEPRSDEVLENIHSLLFEKRSRLLNSNCFKNQTKNGKPFYERMGRFAWQVHNLFQTFILAVDLFIIGSQFHAVYFAVAVIYPQFELNNFWLFFIFLLFQLRLVLLFTSLLIFAHANILTGTFAVLSLQLYKEHFRALCQPLKQVKKRQKIDETKRLTRYLEQLRIGATRTLLSVIKADWTVSHAFIAFLAVHCPLNSVLVGILALRPLVPVATFFVVLVALFECDTIFGIHLVMANVNGYIHRPVTVFMHHHQLRMRKRTFNAEDHLQGDSTLKSTDVQGCLKAGHFIEHHHVHRRYGFTYTKTLGVVSMLTYVRYLLLNSQLFMYVFTWIKEMER